MALAISSDKSQVSLNETYTITITPPQGGSFHHHVTLFESSDGGQNWTAIETWYTYGSSQPLQKQLSKSSAGSYQYQAKDYDINNNVLDQSDIITITVGSTTQTTLTLTANPNPVINNPPAEGPTTLTATLMAGSTPLSGKTITFNIYQLYPDGTPYPTPIYSDTAQTNESGQASLGITPSLWWAQYPGILQVKARAEFFGDETYGPSQSDYVLISWYREQGSLNMVAPSSAQAGVQFQITVTLSPQNYPDDYQNQTIKLKRDDTVIAQAQTDNNGVAYFYQTLNPGTYTFQAVYDGKIGGISPCQSTEQQITVSGTGTLSLSATPGSGQILYEWSKYEGANFNHYRLKVGTSSGGSDVANLTFSDVNTVSHLLTGLTNGTTYYARIYAEASDNSVLAQSSEVQATPQATAYTEVSGTATSQKISLTRAVSGQIISASTWNQDEEAIENFTGKIYIGQATIPVNVKDVKINLPSGLPSSFKVFGILESPIPTAFSIEDITSTSFKLHLSAALPYSAIFHFLIFGVS
ncbi:Ig-like domain repeat protein [bacterium]|nr:Ig-like domain repeat protein [bacterium]